MDNWVYETVISYVAAMIDAEGNIGIGIRRPRNGRSPRHQGYVVFTNTSRLVIDEIVHFFPGTIQNPTPSQTSNKKIWRIHWSDHGMVTLLKAIRPFMIIKRAQADLIFDLVATTIPAKGRPRYWRITPELLSTRDELRRKMLSLNGRLISTSVFAS